jgi:all-trans-retinol dehydrogenase (NAD+)
MKSLANLNVVITGGAAGIGKEMAMLFAKEKANLALIDIDESKLYATARELATNGTRVQTYICNVGDHREVERVCQEVTGDFGKIDVLVNNAGIVVGKPIVDATIEDLNRTMDINVIGVIWMTKQFLPAMIQRNSGHIVNIASAAGTLALPRLANYCASKFAVVGFNDSLRMEMKKYGHTGIKTTCVCPSIIDTGMFTGFKAPLLNPLLKPEAVARKIVAGVKREHTYVKLPFMVKLIPLFKLLPATVVDWIGERLGTSRAMDHFQGH